MAGEDKESRTERATPRRRRQAREKGKVALSPEVGAAAMLLVAIVVLYATGPRIWSALQEIYRMHLGALSRDEMTVRAATRLLTDLLVGAFLPVAPLLLTLLVIAVLSSVAQVGLLVTPESFAPKWSQFNPVAGMKRLFSLRSVVKLGTSTLKMAAILAVSYVCLRGHLPGIIRLSGATPETMVGTVSRATFDLGLRASLLLMVIAAMDYAYQRWQYERDLRMTKEEVKEEHKLTEGDPTTKRRIRGAQIAMARQRMLADVKKADVVIRNPTHFAVALQYDPAVASAPVVLAKGADRMAERILKEARKHRIPEIHDAPVARAIYKAVEVGQQIPPKLYQVVARLLVQVYRMTKRRPITKRNN